MNVSKRTLFQIYCNENIPTNILSAVEAHVFDNVISKNNFSENQCREIKKKKLRGFISRLLKKRTRSPTGLYRILKNAIKIGWTVKFYCFSNQQQRRHKKEFAECYRKTQINNVLQRVNVNLCEELVLVTWVGLHKAVERLAFEVASMVHSAKEIVTKIKKTIASEVSKPISYTSDEGLALYEGGGFSNHSYKLM